MDATFSDYGIVIAVVGGFIVLFTLLWFFKPPSEPEKKEEEPAEEPVEAKPKKKKPKAQKKKPVKSTTPKFVYGVSNLEIRKFASKKEIMSLAVSPNGEIIAAMHRGYTGRMYLLKNITNGVTPANYAINFGNENVTACAFSPDSKHLYAAFDFSRAVAIFRVATKRNSSGRYWAEKVRTKANVSKTEITNIVTAGELFISSSSDISVAIGNVKGEILARVTSHQMANYDADISSDGRYVAIGAKTREVRLWELTYDNAGKFASVPRASKTYFKGHKTSVYGISFSGDGKHAVTSSKDGMLRVYDTDLDASVSGDPEILHAIRHPVKDAIYDRVRYAPKSDVIAANTGSTLYFYDAKTCALLHSVENVHEVFVTFAWSGNGRFIVTAGREGLRVFKNPKL